MNKEQHTYCPNNFRKWLLVVTVIFNVFAFSGYYSNSQSNIYTFQTELSVSNPQVLEKAIDYAKFIRTSRNAEIFLSSNKSWKYALLAYNTTKKVEFESVLNRFSSFNSKNFWFLIKTIPQGSDEDYFAPNLG